MPRFGEMTGVVKKCKRGKGLCVLLICVSPSEIQQMWCQVRNAILSIMRIYVFLLLQLMLRNDMDIPSILDTSVLR